MEQALFVTVAGMGGVFCFLVLLICAMKLLAYLVDEEDALDKVAVAIAVARRGK